MKTLDKVDYFNAKIVILKNEVIWIKHGKWFYRISAKKGEVYSLKDMAKEEYLSELVLYDFGEYRGSENSVVETECGKRKYAKVYIRKGEYII